MNEAVKVLVVDDEESIREFLQIMLKREGFEVTVAESAPQAIIEFNKIKYEIVVSDMSMPEMTGIELLEKIKELDPSTIVVIMTAYGSAESAVQAMKLGASDYISKPFEIDELLIVLNKALKAANLERENHRLKAELRKEFSFGNIIGNSDAMQSVFDLIKRVSQTNTNIMILGESGTGKELVAHALHNSSPRCDEPFISINCGAIPETLIESELFGYKKGAFTGANTDRDGLFKAANGGTLFLDEIGELPMNMQVKLLRAIQTKFVRPVGSTEDISVDVRIICATNRNLEDAIEAGEYREDLYYRLNVIQIKLPSLRERSDDIPLLVNHFMSTYVKSMDKEINGFSPEALDLMCGYPFPGNVRELENVVERAVALTQGDRVEVEALPPKVREYTGGVSPAASMHQESIRTLADSRSSLIASDDVFNLESKIEEFERQYILKALEQTNGVKKKAAKLLGVSFRSLRYRIAKYKIEDLDPSEDEGA